MSMVARLRPELIRVTPPWRTFTHTIAGLVATLTAERELPAGSEGETVRLIAAREAEASTALLDIRTGVPHARLGTIRQVAIAMALSASGLYEAVPTVPIQIVVLLLSPASATTAHVAGLAEVATLLRSSALRTELLDAPTGAAALDVLHRHARVDP